MELVRVVAPRVEQLADDRWRTLTVGRYALADGRRIVVPAGYDTDLASIPRVLWSVPGWAPWELSLAAPVAHDYLYRSGGALAFREYGGYMVPAPLTRPETDRLFYFVMRDQGIGMLRAGIAYGVVRAVAGGAWRE